MIKLDQQFVTTIQTSLGAATTTTVTNTLFVSDVRIDFNTGAIYACIRRGTFDGATFTPNMAPSNVVVNPDGSFLSDDGFYHGNLGAATQLVAQLRATFDQFVLSSGAVTGSEV
jgi:hypothetical protein